jgi:hypothetical protein
MINLIPPDLKLPPMDTFIIVFFKDLPDPDAGISFCVGHFNGEKFIAKDAPSSMTRFLKYPVGWEEIKPSQEALDAMTALRDKENPQTA